LGRLGKSNNLMESILFKPKNMHQKTFDCLRRGADKANRHALIIMEKRFGTRIIYGIRSAFNRSEMA